jgi:hypothetical protein
MTKTRAPLQTAVTPDETKPGPRGTNDAEVVLLEPA